MKNLRIIEKQNSAITVNCSQYLCSVTRILQELDHSNCWPSSVCFLNESEVMLFRSMSFADDELSIVANCRSPGRRCPYPPFCTEQLYIF